MHRENRYVSVLVLASERCADVRLMGWAYGEDFPRRPLDRPHHPLEGAYVLENRRLRPIGELWALLREERDLIERSA